MSAPKLTEAQARRLRQIGDEWSVLPLGGDRRSDAVLLRKGCVENRCTDVTPADWGTNPVRIYRTEWRITPLGREALKGAGHADD